jgi:hypothetical protein
MIANGTLTTIEDEVDIYVSLTELCEYFTNSSIKMKHEAAEIKGPDAKYAQGMVDIMFTIANELCEFGKFEAQKRMIEGPEDLLRMIDKANGGIVE